MDLSTPPVVLTFSVFDPSGRGGIQADVEVSASLGCHCTPVITAICTSSQSDEADVLPIDSPLLVQQARSILEDYEVAAIKIGFVGSINNTEAIQAILSDYPSIPVIFEPSFCLIDEEESDKNELVKAVETLLLPMSDVVITSLGEAREISATTDTARATAQALLDAGPSTALINSTDLRRRESVYHLYTDDGSCKSFEWKEHLSPSTFGAETTAAAALACFLAHSSSVATAAERAVSFAQKSVSKAWQLGFDRPTPNRFFWVNETPDSEQDCSSSAH